MEADTVNQSFSLLDKSQTFLGVILTLVVLCIFLDEDSNFIRKLIKGHTVRFVDTLNNLGRNLKKRIEDFQENDDYKQVLSWSKDKGQRPEILIEAQKLNYQTYLTILAYQTDISATYPKIERVLKYNEPIMAPLYVFGYALIIFLIDEIGRFFVGECPVLLYGINVFTIVSIAFWTVLWIVFWNNFSLNDNEDESEGEKREENKRHIPHFPLWIGIGLKTIIFGGVYFLSIKYWPWNLMNAWGKLLWAVIAILLPLLVVGGIRVYYFNKKGYYTYGQILGHLVGLLFYAAVITGICLLAGEMPEVTGGFLTDEKWTRFLIVMFAAFNGIILPYAIPYRKSYCLYKEYRREINNTQKSIDTGIKDFKENYKNLCVKIAKILTKKENQESVSNQ